MADGHRTDFTSKDGIGVWNSSGKNHDKEENDHFRTSIIIMMINIIFFLGGGGAEEAAS